jgi:hypothetical protein
MIEPESSAFIPLSLHALFALELPEAEYVVEGILPTEAFCLLHGREKSGKGLLSLDLSASVALGEPFLDRAVKEGPAVYCAAEENIRDIRARVAERFGNRRDASFHVLPLDGSTGDRLQLEDPVAMQRLYDMIKEVEPRVVVLDPLRELHSGQEDSSDEMAPILRPVRQLAHDTRTTIILNHHQNKGGGFRGSTAILAAADLEWALTRTDGDDDTGGSPRGKLKIEGRHGPRTILNMRLGQGLRWELDQSLLLPLDPRTRERILDHLVAVNMWHTAEEIATGTGIKLKTIQNVLAGMMKEIPRPFAVQATGAKNNPRQYRTIAPRFDQLITEDLGRMIPPDGFPLRGSFGGNHLGAAIGEAGNDRYTR